MANDYTTYLKSTVFGVWFTSAHTNNVTKTLSCSRSYLTGTMIWYLLQTVKNTWIALSHADEMQPLYELVSPYLMFICTWSVFGVLSKNGFYLSSQADIRVGPSLSASDNEAGAAEVFERSAAVYKALQYVTFLYLEDGSSLLTNNATTRNGAQKLGEFCFVHSSKPKAFRGFRGGDWSICGCTWKQNP